MKKMCRILLCALCSLGIFSCDMLGEGGLGSGAGDGKLCVSFDESVSFMTRSGLPLPDTSQFLLKITDKDGKVIFDGQFGDCPEALCVDPGSYNIRAVSSEFLKPAFDAPQFGDEQCVVVPKGGSSSVKLLCTQLNSGISLEVDSDFLTEFPNAVLFLKSAEGKLMYSYREQRAAYFNPGQVSVVMNDADGDQVLMSRDLAPRQMLRVRVNVPENCLPAAPSLSVSVDTSRVWVRDECTIGQSYKGTDTDEAYTVAQARTLAGNDDVWVSGYIVGGDLTSASASFVAPFESRTCILLGPRSSTVDRSACLSVQLPSGDVRDAINLVDNPSMLGKKVYVRGDLVESYYGLPGMKNTSEYKIF